MIHEDSVGKGSVIRLPYSLFVKLPGYQEFTVFFDIAGDQHNWVVKEELRCMAFGIDITNQFGRQLILREIYRQAENVSQQIEDQKILKQFEFYHPIDD